MVVLSKASTRRHRSQCFLRYVVHTCAPAKRCAVFVCLVQDNLQQLFIEKTVSSKFALAPRGYGRGSFRFYEIFKLGAIPIYVWDDIEWLPYMDKIDYSTICVSIHSSQLDTLKTKLLAIDESAYERMRSAYQFIQHMFEMEYMCEYTCSL